MLLNVLLKPCEKRPGRRETQNAAGLTERQENSQSNESIVILNLQGIQKKSKEEQTQEGRRVLKKQIKKGKRKDKKE